MSKKSKTTTTNSSTGTAATKIDPMVMGMGVDNYGRAQGIANGLTAYTGQRVADFNADQLAGQAAVRGIANTRAPGFESAAAAQKELTTFQPQQVAATGYDPASANAASISRGDVRDLSAGQVKDADLSAYINPFEKDVLQQGLDDLDLAWQRQRASDSQRARARGAWGGDRHGVVDALTSEASLREARGLTAQLRLAGHDRATALAAQDIDRRFAADQANQGYDFNVAERNAAMAQQANLANTDAVNQARAFRASQQLAAAQSNQNADLAGAGVRQGAAGLLAGVTKDQIADEIARAQLLNGIGDAQQENAQAQLDADYNEFVRAQEAGIAGQQLVNSAFGLVPVPQTITTTDKSRSVQKHQDTGAMIQAALQMAQTFAMSDGRAKRDIETTHYDRRGRRWVNYRYHWDDPDVRRHGVIAQEILETDPEAVVTDPSGTYWVDYSKLEA